MFDKYSRQSTNQSNNKLYVETLCSIHIDLEDKVLKYSFTRSKILETRDSYDACRLSEWTVRISIKCFHVTTRS